MLSLTAPWGLTWRVSPQHSWHVQRCSLRLQVQPQFQSGFGLMKNQDICSKFGVVFLSERERTEAHVAHVYRWHRFLFTHQCIRDHALLVKSKTSSPVNARKLNPAPSHRALQSWTKVSVLNSTHWQCNSNTRALLFAYPYASLSLSLPLSLTHTPLYAHTHSRTHSLWRPGVSLNRHMITSWEPVKSGDWPCEGSPAWSITIGSGWREAGLQKCCEWKEV